MIDFLLHATLGNLMIALSLAAMAYGVQTVLRRPALAHLLWVLVLLKLLTPPLLTAPVAVPQAWFAPSATAPIERATTELTTNDAPPTRQTTRAPETRTILFAVWVTGSLLVLVMSLQRIVRFGRLLRLATSAAPEELSVLTERLRERLGIRARVDLLCTRAAVSPLIWWTGGRIRLVLPKSVLSGLERADLECVIAHELSHVARHDHFVRWLEWFAIVAHWWNPLVWIATRELRACEELCCDADALVALDRPRRDYGRSLVRAIGCLTPQTPVAPTLASGMSGGRDIDRRIRLIASREKLPMTPKRIRGLFLLAAVVVLPPGIAQSPQEDALEGVGEWLDGGVESGHITDEQARIMLAALQSRTGVASTILRSQPAPGFILTYSGETLAEPSLFRRFIFPPRQPLTASEVADRRAWAALLEAELPDGLSDLEIEVAADGRVTMEGVTVAGPAGSQESMSEFARQIGEALGGYVTFYREANATDPDNSGRRFRMEIF